MNENLNSNQPEQHFNPATWAELREYIASVYEQMKETDRRMKETDRRMQETDRRMQETDREVQETSRVVRETSRWLEGYDKRLEEQKEETKRRMRELNAQFLSQSGHIVEGLMEPAAMNIFKKAGFNIVSCWKEMKTSIKQPDGTIKKMEIDLYYHDTTEAIAVEVKINCTKEKVDHFLEQMQKFKEFFPRFSDVKVYAAIAALNYERGADEYAAEKGLYVIRVTDNDVFSLDDASKEDRRCF